MDCYIKDSTTISPVWPLNQPSDIQKRVGKLAHLCGIPSSDIIKDSLLNRDGVYLNFPISKDNQSNIQSRAVSSTKSTNPSPKRKVSKHSARSAVQKVPEREITSGYLYRRTSDNVHITLTDDFWKSPNCITQKEAQLADDGFDKREILIRMKDEIDQLRVLFEEEKLAHKTDSKKSKDDHLRILQIIHEEHLDHFRAIEFDRKQELQTVKRNQQEEIEQISASFDTERKKLNQELEFLRERFELQKNFLNDESERKWKDKEAQLLYEMEEKTQQLLSDQKVELLKEKNHALDQLTTDNNAHEMSIMEQHQDEMDKLLRKFASSAHDTDKLKIALKELSVVKDEYAEMKNTLTEVKEKLRKTENELGDVKVKLGGFENNFTEKIAEVEERYSTRIDNLKKANLELRRKYLKKCEELHVLGTKKRDIQIDETMGAKGLMQSVINSVTRTNANLMASQVQLDEKRIDRRLTASANTDFVEVPTLPIENDLMDSLRYQKTALGVSLPLLNAKRGLIRPRSCR